MSDPRKFLAAFRRPGQLLLSGAAALAGGIVTYSVWLVLFLGVRSFDSPQLEAVLRLLAPVVTAFGFAAGLVALKRLTGDRKTRLVRILPWPLAGCVIGAVAVYWLGPMLIVFGMLLAGTGSIILREMMAAYRREAESGQNG